MLSKHKVDLGALGVVECEVLCAATIVRKQSEDNYDSVEILRVIAPLGPVRADVTKLLSDEAIEEIESEIHDSLQGIRPTTTSYETA
jgi:hypothetical protein